MAKLRNKKGQFMKGHHKVPKTHHHRRRNPTPLGAARLARALTARGGLARAGRILVVR